MCSMTARQRTGRTGAGWSLLHWRCSREERSCGPPVNMPLRKRHAKGNIASIMFLHETNALPLRIVPMQAPPMALDTVIALFAVVLFTKTILAIWVMSRGLPTDDEMDAPIGDERSFTVSCVFFVASVQRATSVRYGSSLDVGERTDHKEGLGSYHERDVSLRIADGWRHIKRYLYFLTFVIKPCPKRLAMCRGWKSL